MSLKVKRNYLEIYSIDDLIDVKIVPKEFTIESYRSTKLSTK